MRMLLEAGADPHAVHGDIWITVFIVAEEARLASKAANAFH
ncbi:hypothetical protein AB4Z21_09450 [Paenibacillus sp. MCAF20]